MPGSEKLSQQPSRCRGKDTVRPHDLRAAAGRTVAIGLLLESVISDEATAA